MFLVKRNTGETFHISSITRTMFKHWQEAMIEQLSSLLGNHLSHTTIQNIVDQIPENIVIVEESSIYYSGTINYYNLEIVIMNDKKVATDLLLLSSTNCSKNICDKIYCEIIEESADVLYGEVNCGKYNSIIIYNNGKLIPESVKETETHSKLDTQKPVIALIKTIFKYYCETDEIYEKTTYKLLVYIPSAQSP